MYKIVCNDLLGDVLKDFLDLACERYSVRKYSDREIEDEKLEKILKAAQVAPTGNNFQPQRVFVIKSEEGLEKIRNFTPYCFGAPIVLLICYDKSVSWKTVDGHDAGLDDAVIATTQMMLEAYDLGIGSVWVRGYDKRVMDELLTCRRTWSLSRCFLSDILQKKPVLPHCIPEM